MKHFAILFAFYLSALTAAPLIMKVMPCIVLKTECSEKADNCNKEKGSDKKSKSGCPFGICCNNCLFFHNQSQEVSFEAPSTTDDFVFSRNESIFSTYLADCWHPPEIIFCS